MNIKRIAKPITLLVLCLTTITGCASMNKTFRNVPVEDRDKQKTLFEGKSPKEIVTVLGEPASVGWSNPDSYGRSVYYLAYIVGEGTTTTFDLMTNGENLTCRYFNFKKDAAFKFTSRDINDSSSQGTADASCALLKSKGTRIYDDSMIK